VRAVGRQCAFPGGIGGEVDALELAEPPLWFCLATSGDEILVDLVEADDVFIEQGDVALCGVTVELPEQCRTDVDR